jgi:hypothetical protein
MKTRGYVVATKREIDLALAKSGPLEPATTFARAEKRLKATRKACPGLKWGVWQIVAKEVKWKP